MSLLNLQNLPGIDSAIESVENEFGWGPNAPLVVVGGTMYSGALDSTNTPTTLLRRGLVIGRITASSYFTNYDPAATDGSQEPVGILWSTVNMYDPNTGAVRNKDVTVVVGWNNLKVNNLYGFDEYARARLKEKFLYDDLRAPVDVFKAVTKATDYTVLSTDNGTHFFATGAANFTLPAITTCRGYRFRFSMLADANLTVTAPTGKLVTFNNATATSVAFSTSSNKIGASVEIVGLPDSTKYLAIPHGANTMTVA